MILIGTMNLTRTRETGDFYCPGCQTNRSYRLRAKRPFLTIYFIPVIPVGGAELFIQCDGCKANWDVNVLEMNREMHQEAQAAQFREDGLRTAILVTTADGTISEKEISALLTVAHKLLERPLDREELGALCASAARLGITAANYVESCKKRWNPSQGIVILQAAFLAASAEGDLGPGQLAMLADLKSRLNFTDREYVEAIEEAIALAE